MPKEKVYGDQRFIPSTSDDPVEDDAPIVEVRWDRESGFVSLVTRLERCEVPAPGEDILASYGYYVELDRAAINKLIRNLRRARDQAFGRDE